MTIGSPYWPNMVLTVGTLGGRIMGREAFSGSAANNPEQKTCLQREIEATDSQIDQPVYELYGLTDEEIKIVESDRSYTKLQRGGRRIDDPQTPNTRFS